jgi:hypothetical protein
MREEWIHFLWKMKRLPLKLYTTKGENLEIISPGIHNKESGPDFFNARIKIGDILWTGNVEIHIQSSDWLKHNHQFDLAYNNVILHVVYKHDLEVQISKEIIPVLELASFLECEDLQKMKLSLQNENIIACAKSWNEVPGIVKMKEIETSFFRRLERKSNLFSKRLHEINHDVLRLKLELLGKIIATKTNEIPMIELISRIPLNHLFRLNDELRIALLLGVSGLIPDNSIDLEIDKLKKDADFLLTKFQLTPMNSASWKFFGCRPPAYPTIRIVLFALLVSDEMLFQDFENESEIVFWLEKKEIQFPHFWKFHTHFTKSNSRFINSLSKELKILIITNYFIPFHYWKLSMENEIEFIEKLIELAISLPPEKNAKIEKFKKLGLKPKSIFETQGLLELINEFCVNKKCLSCQIGTKLLLK